MTAISRRYLAVRACPDGRRAAIGQPVADRPGVRLLDTSHMSSARLARFGNRGNRGKRSLVQSRPDPPLIHPRAHSTMTDHAPADQWAMRGTGGVGAPPEEAP